MLARRVGFGNIYRLDGLQAQTVLACAPRRGRVASQARPTAAHRPPRWPAL